MLISFLYVTRNILIIVLYKVYKAAHNWCQLSFYKQIGKQQLKQANSIFIDSKVFEGATNGVAIIYNSSCNKFCYSCNSNPLDIRVRAL